MLCFICSHLDSWRMCICTVRPHLIYLLSSDVIYEHTSRFLCHYPSSRMPVHHREESALSERWLGFWWSASHQSHFISSIKSPGSALIYKKKVLCEALRQSIMCKYHQVKNGTSSINLVSLSNEEEQWGIFTELRVIKWKFTNCVLVEPHNRFIKR